MSNTELPKGQEIQLSPRRLEAAAAMSLHASAKSIPDEQLSAMRQEDTMQRILALASTREGLAEIIALNEKSK